MNPAFPKIIDFVKGKFPNQDFIPLHEPRFVGNERKYVLDAIDSTFVSSVGEYVNRFEKNIAEIVGTNYAVAIVNGTSALHLALILADVQANDEVISQSLTFIATANAISYIGAKPVFIDIDRDSLGMSPNALHNFLEKYGEKRSDGFCYNKATNRRIKACVPMHSFGLPCRIDELQTICLAWNIALVEDSAESIGSYYKGKHTGSFGLLGVFSFNGNKTVTCGGGGAIVTNDEKLAKLGKHLSTQAKIPHQWDFAHDYVGYNYRMPNLNAAMMCAQLELLNKFVANKRELSAAYAAFFKSLGVSFVPELEKANSNYWLNAILWNNREERDEFLKYANENGVMSRPSWTLMNKLQMFQDCQTDGLENSVWIEDRLVNIPSSVRI